MTLDALIIGAGIAGLHTAWRLQAHGLGVRVLEARARTGGRLAATDGEESALDLGASWIWPQEHAVNDLVRELGLTTFPQFASGALLYDLPGGVQAVRGAGGSESRRIRGGTRALASAIVERLRPDTIELNARVKRIHGMSTGPLGVVLENGDEYEAVRVIVALPPALAMHALCFEPALSSTFTALARRTPVWMGAIVKTVVTYQRPFWRERGLSGAALSQVGPMQEIHDLSPSPEGGGRAALFGFTGLGPGDAAPSKEDALRQLVRLFGEEASQPTGFHQRDWSREIHTSPPDAAELQDYGLFGHAAYRASHMGGRLDFCSCETGGPDGHIESALAASKWTIKKALERARLDRD